MEKALRTVPLTLAQYSLLKNLEGGSYKTSAELARQSFVSPQTMHTMLGSMEKTGLIKKEAISGNKKSIHIVITTAGAEKLQVAEAALHKVYKVGNEALSSDEHALLNEFLEKLHDSFAL